MFSYYLVIISDTYRMAKQTKEQGRLFCQKGINEDS